MKKILTSCILPTLLFSVSTLASETKGYYLKPYIGLSFMSDINQNTGAEDIDVQLDQGFVAGGAFGYRYNDQVAAEFAWEYRTNDSETQLGGSNFPEGNYASNVLYVNGIYFFNPYGLLTPYAGVGLGWMQEIDIDLERDGLEDSFSNSGSITYQGFAGIEYKFTSKWSIHTELRYAGGKSGNLKNEDQNSEDVIIADLNYQPFTWQLGGKYSF
jgi:hypothetical protein